MLHSFVVLLKSTNDGVVTNSLGRPAQAWFLNRLLGLKELLVQIGAKNLIQHQEQSKITNILKMLDDIHKTEHTKDEKDQKEKGVNFDGKILEYLDEIHQAEDKINSAINAYSTENAERASNIHYHLETLHSATKGIEREFKGKNIGKDLRPYTVSMLLRKSGKLVPVNKYIKTGERYMLRFTTLTSLLSEVAEHWVFQDSPNIKELLPETAQVIKNNKLIELKEYKSSLRLYKLFFEIERIKVNENKEKSWGNSTSYSRFAQDKYYNNVSNTITMEINSPTSFRRGGYDLVLPEPGHVFKNLWEKWNEHCPEGMEIDFRWPAFARDCIIVDSLNEVNTDRWGVADGTLGFNKGFYGEVVFRLLPKDKVNKRWQPLWDGANATMYLLARYAYYCGIGHHTTIGMGQCRLLGDKDISQKTP